MDAKPFTAQYQISGDLDFFPSELKPVGKGKPMRNPTSMVHRTDTKILTTIGEGVRALQIKGIDPVIRRIIASKETKTMTILLLSVQFLERKLPAPHAKSRENKTTVSP